MSKLRVFPFGTQPSPGHLADQLPVHGIFDAVGNRRLWMITEHDFYQTVGLRNVFEHLAALFAHLSAAVDRRYPAVLNCPAHRFRQHSRYTLDTTEIDFAIGLSVAIEHTAASPWKMTSPRRVAGPELHAV